MELLANRETSGIFVPKRKLSGKPIHTVSKGKVQHQHRLTKAEVKQLVAERRAGAQVKDLATKYNVDKSTVWWHMKRAN